MDTSSDDKAPFWRSLSTASKKIAFCRMLADGRFIFSFVGNAGKKFDGFKCHVISLLEVVKPEARCASGSIAMKLVQACWLATQ